MTLELSPLVDDCARLVDRRIGFSLTIPGRPELRAPEPTAGVSEPAYEGLVVLADLPVTLRYRHDEMPIERPNLDVFAATYAANRCPADAPRRVQAAPDAQCRAWGVVAAASALYPLREPLVDGNDSEELLVLARNGLLVVLTKRFARDTTSWVSWALLASALAAGLAWDSARVDEPVTAVWPDSRFLERGIGGTLAARLSGTAIELAAAAGSGRHELLFERLLALLQGAEPPRYAFSPAELAAFEAFIADGCELPDLRARLVELVHEVKTAHDLRGLAILGMHVLGRHRATFAADPSSTAFDHFVD